MKKYSKEFNLSTAEQRSTRWYEERAGLPSASGLGALFDTKADGTPSARAKAYLKQLAYEREFGVTHDKYDTSAMQDGRYYEDFAKLVYAKETGNTVNPATSYISDWFVATPDGIVWERSKEPNLIGGQLKGRPHTIGKGLLECKIMRDNSFMDFIDNSIPLDHELQTQGQLMASGLDWVDYIVVNIKTRAYYIVRVNRNNKLIKRIYERLHEPLDLPKIDFGNVKRFDPELLVDYMGGDKGFSTPPEIIKNLPF